jgi:hypothetical protein
MTDTQRNNMLPGVRVRVTAPEPEHQAYRNDTGHINDVRDFGERRFCEVYLEQKQTFVTFESTELHVIR